ncbi:MAG: hypothetical protein HKO81_00170 [Flavobacteriaceae bacterium]|nr:hypothetical protein [Flavobacteriaceae bacterium]
MQFKNISQRKKFALSILLDAIGYLSFAFPFIDILWAPLSGYIMTRLYKGSPGKIAGIIAFIEEALAGLDIIPTFTIMWCYSYFYMKKTEDTIIEVEAE